MNYINKILKKLSEPDLSSEQRGIIEKELELIKNSNKLIENCVSICHDSDILGFV